MDEEAAALSELADEALTGDGTHRQTELRFGPTEIVLLRSGIGFANATAAAAYAFHTFGSDVPIISIGTAGGLAADVNLGDVVVGDRYVNLNADATAFGYALGQVPGMPEHYDADPSLLRRIRASTHPVRLLARPIGSSEMFVTTRRAVELRANFPEVAAVDMESAAIAQYAHVHKMSFISVRGISDLCAPDGEEFLTHRDHTASRAAAVVATLLRGISAQS
ncbi:adenosylhomocysteine nucleosidase [Paramicrobacterium humi]|uniref:adenosylhomocysteine nucleosidase n=2 Tax=Paramicrobacterium humi TaxID=640635 RepID=A0A1H4LWV9_9MICO|nr:adenosylhomocysteine nucleosidase [Microbacterium humi]